MGDPGVLATAYKRAPLKWLGWIAQWLPIIWLAPKPTPNVYTIANNMLQPTSSNGHHCKHFQLPHELQTKTCNSPNHVKSPHHVVCDNANALVGISNHYIWCNYYTFSLTTVSELHTCQSCASTILEKCVSSSITQDIQCI